MRYARNVFVLAAIAALVGCTPDGGDSTPDGDRPSDAAADGPAADAAPDRGPDDVGPDMRPEDDMAIGLDMAIGFDMTPDLGPVADMGPVPDMAPDLGPVLDMAPDLGPVPDMALDMALDMAPDMAPVGVCGDGVVDDGEACDLGPDNGAGHGCTAMCAREGECGDGLLQRAFEECDEGDTAPGGFCDAECRANELVDPLGHERWPEGARVFVSNGFEMGGPLIIEAGAVVTLEGNWTLTDDLTLRGRPGLPVTVHPRPESRCSSFLIRLSGHTLVAEHVVLEHARDGVFGRDGRLEIRDSVIRDLCTESSAGIAGIYLADTTSGVVERVVMRDFVARAGGNPGRHEADDLRFAASDGGRAGSVSGLTFLGEGELVVDGLEISRLTAGPGGDGGDAEQERAGAGGLGGGVYGLILGRTVRVRDVRISELRGGAGGAAGSAGFGIISVGGDGGPAVGITTEFARPAMQSPVIENVEIAGLWSGAGGRGSRGRENIRGPGFGGGLGGRQGQVRGVLHDDDALLRLSNVAIHGLRLGALGQGGQGGPGAAGEDGEPGGDGGSGGGAGLAWTDPLVGIEVAGPIEVRHATIVIDDQPGALPEPAPGGVPAPGGEVGDEGNIVREIALYGVLAKQGHRGPVLDSIIVGDALEGPRWQETTGLAGSANDLEVTDALIWGFDQPITAVQARRIVQEDPLFVDRDGGDVRPAADSPAVGQGTPSAVTHDLRGVERPDPPTLGAFEPAAP